MQVQPAAPMLEELTPLDKIEVRRFMPRHIVVTGNVPTPNTKRFQHTRFSVVCSSVKRAIELAEEAHPGFITMGIADQGAVDKVDL